MDRPALVQDVRHALRSMGAQLARLNGAVGASVELKGLDVELLDHIGQVGPVTPSELAVGLHIHPATLTGILDRLEAGGWLARERSSDDRRKVSLRALRTRAPELVRLYAPMNSAITKACANLTAEQLVTVRDFLSAISDAAAAAVDDLRGDDD
jgi:DNA-binding MarR family transcriptional regulator